MLFFLVFFLVFFSMHALTWQRFSSQLDLGQNKAAWGYLGAAFLALTPILVHLLPHSWPQGAIWVLWQLTFVWFGLIFYLFLLQMGAFLVSGLLYLTRSRAARAFKGKAAAWSVLLLALIIVCSGLWQARQPPKVAAYEISSPKLESDMDIVFLADLHLGVQKSFARLKKIVSAIKDLGPDLILFGGDLVNDHPQWLQGQAELLAKLEPPLGKLAVLGNHDFYVGAEQAEQLYEQAGIQLLRQEEKILQESGFRIMGLDDPTGRENPRQWQEDRILELNSNAAGLEDYTILLTHRPWGYAEASVPADVDLHLAAHTHKGQLFPFCVFVRLQFRHVYGLYQNGDAALLVTSGAGTWGPPMRVLAPAEIVWLRLVPEE